MARRWGPVHTQQRVLSGAGPVEGGGMEGGQHLELLVYGSSGRLIVGATKI